MPHLDLGDICLHYEEHGVGRPILCLAELGGSTRTWRHVVGALAQDHRLLLLDIRGTGRSEKPCQPYSMAAIADDVQRFLTRQGIDSIDIMGCAMGSIVALEVALQAPALVRSLLLCSVSPDIPEKTRLYAGQRASDIRAGGMRVASCTSAELSFPEGIALPFAVARSEYEADFLANDPDAYAALTEALLDWQGGPRLASIACPCLCLAGDQDFMWDPAVVEATTRALPNASFDVVEAAGHFPPLSSPDGFVAKARAFLDSRPD